MKPTIYWLSVLATISNIYFAKGKDLECEQHIDVKENGNITIKLLDNVWLHNFNNHSNTEISTLNRRCKLILTAEQNMLLQVTIRYVPKVKGCNNGYLHLGNDIFRIDIESMTSFKFCDAVWDLEIVSRQHIMWLTYMHSDQEEVSPETAEVHVKAQYPVTCNMSEFVCSPVQCVPRSSICDGKIDCDNRRDEYCMQRSVYNYGAPIGPLCFLCNDGNCIQPVLPLYDDDYGKVLPYLCDEYNHCLDGSDERKDMCYRTKSKVSDLLTCVPRDHRFGPHVAVRFWQDRICDGVQDCFYNEDEAFCSETTEDDKGVDLSGIVITCAAVVILISTFSFFAYRSGKTARRENQNTNDQITSRSRIYRSHDSQDAMEVCKLQSVTEEPEDP